MSSSTCVISPVIVGFSLVKVFRNTCLVDKTLEDVVVTVVVVPDWNIALPDYTSEAVVEVVRVEEAAGYKG